MEWLLLLAAGYLLTRPAPPSVEGSENVQADIVTGGQVFQGPQPALIPTTTGFDADVERSGPDRIGSTIGSGTPAGQITGPGINLNIGGVLNFIGGILNTISPALGPSAPIARTAGSVAIAIGWALPTPAPAAQPAPVGGAPRAATVDRDPIEAGLRDIQAGMPGGERYDLDFSRGGFVFDPSGSGAGRGVVETVQGIKEFELPALDWGAPEAPEAGGYWEGDGAA